MNVCILYGCISYIIHLINSYFISSHLLVLHHLVVTPILSPLDLTARFNLIIVHNLLIF